MADEVAHMTAAVAGLAAEVVATADQMKAETTKILELLANPPSTGVDPAAVEEAVRGINGLAGNLHDAVAAAQAALATPTA